MTPQNIGLHFLGSSVKVGARNEFIFMCFNISILSYSLIFDAHPFLKSSVVDPKFVVRVLPDRQNLVHENAKGPHITPGSEMMKCELILVGT